jgi:hypothetical protein
LEKIWFFSVKSWFFTRNTPKFFAPPSARRIFFKCVPPSLTWNCGPRKTDNTMSKRHTTIEQHVSHSGLPDWVHVWKFFAPPSARRIFFKCVPPSLTWNRGSAPVYGFWLHLWYLQTFITDDQLSEESLTNCFNVSNIIDEKDGHLWNILLLLKILEFSFIVFSSFPKSNVSIFLLVSLKFLKRQYLSLWYNETIKLKLNS